MRPLYILNTRDQFFYPISPWRFFIRHILLWGIVLGVFTFGILYLLALNQILDPWGFLRKQEVIQKSSMLRDQYEKLLTLSQQIESFHQKENLKYRPLLAIKPLESGFWNMGIGGAEIYPNISSDALKKILWEVNNVTLKSHLLKKHYRYYQEAIFNRITEFQSIPIIIPVKGPVISGFGYRLHPLRHIPHLHTGLDIDARYGAPVRATADGVVILSRNKNDGYGNQVEIDHHNGYVTKYAHLSRIKVSLGQKVKRGQIIGYVGSTGISTGPHLHYEILYRNQKIDPLPFLLFEWQ